MKIVVFVLCFSVLLTGRAHAYIDFGTGSYILQVLIASAIGGIFFIRDYLRRLFHLLTGRKSPEKEGVDNPEHHD